MKITYQVEYYDWKRNSINVSKLKQSPMHNRWSNLKNAKDLLIRYLRRELIKDTLSSEDKNKIKRRVVEINKITKKSLIMKKVIDGDLMKCLETFNSKETDRILEKYKDDGRWEDISIDNDGDIILYSEL